MQRHMQIISPTSINPTVNKRNLCDHHYPPCTTHLHRWRRPLPFNHSPCVINTIPRHNGGDSLLGTTDMVGTVGMAEDMHNNKDTGHGNLNLTFFGKIQFLEKWPVT